jgi:hypothetical protein
MRRIERRMAAIDDGLGDRFVRLSVVNMMLGKVRFVLWFLFPHRGIQRLCRSLLRRRQSMPSTVGMAIEI